MIDIAKLDRLSFPERLGEMAAQGFDASLAVWLSLLVEAGNAKFAEICSRRKTTNWEDVYSRSYEKGILCAIHPNGWPPQQGYISPQRSWWEFSLPVLVSRRETHKYPSALSAVEDLAERMIRMGVDENCLIRAIAILRQAKPEKI